MPLANKHNISFENKEGVVKPNYYGSVTQASTVKIGVDKETGEDVYVPFNSIVPMVNPNDLVVDGWDISGLPLDQAMKRAKVLMLLYKSSCIHTWRTRNLWNQSTPDFIALNQSERANNVFNKSMVKLKLIINGPTLKNQKRYQRFQGQNELDKVILWTANTERYADVLPNVNDTADNLIKVLKNHTKKLLQVLSLPLLLSWKSSIY